MTSPLENLVGATKPLSHEPEVWRVLNKAHDLRNLAEYAGEADIDERVAADVVAACEILLASIDAVEQS